MMKRDKLSSLFSYVYMGDAMILFIKGFIIGIGKIIPGVSGALLAINFKVYERAIEAIVNFFDDWKKNLLFIMKLGSGIILSIVLCSNGIMYLLNNYRFITMMFFVGLICGGTYNYAIGIKCNCKDILFMILFIVILFIISYGNISNSYEITHGFMDNIVFFIGGVIEVMASIIPGISGTAIHLILGIYDNILMMISKVFDFQYVLMNINLYISYGLGMMVSFIICMICINYLLKRYPVIFSKIILGLCIYSILMLIIFTFSLKMTILNFIIGLMLLMVGLLIGCLLDK